MGTLPRTGRNEVVVDAPVAAVWDVVVDVTRTGEWSHECQRVEWLDGAHVAKVGARFVGRNRAGRFSWSRRSEIVRLEPGREIVWKTIPTLVYRDSTEWSLLIEPAGDSRTRIVQSYQVLMINPIANRLFYLMVPQHRDRRPELNHDLLRIGEVANATTAAR
ncbi:MAG TPA: SRPBCC family protein [Acidimicrobiia bacterium]|nr:SRPBCC family protein [Acidimicrobiia bacterium]